MKKLLLALLLGCGTLSAQTISSCTPTLCVGNGAPSGACSANYQYVQIDARPIKSFVCTAGTWSASSPYAAQQTTQAGLGTPVAVSAGTPQTLSNVAAGPRNAFQQEAHQIEVEPVLRFIPRIVALFETAIRDAGIAQNWSRLAVAAALSVRAQQVEYKRCPI